MKKESVIVLMFLVLMASVYAAGGGSGGSTFKTPDCTDNSYACTEWSPCDESGKQTRKCTLVETCIEKGGKKPLESADCEYVSSLESKLKCGNLDTVRDRVKCRLELSQGEQFKELDIKYLPEECGAIKGNALKREQCIVRYKSFQKCWRFKDGPERFKCVREGLGLGQNLSEEIKKCNDKLGTERASCIKDVRELVFTEIKFRFYNLEERAESMLEKGADKELVADFITGIEIKKQEFNSAENNAERKQIVNDIQKKWKEFLEKAKSQIK
ncbi:hypothetical protein HYX19_03990 [Candidatus Woesearchaeota archaeon]|nr:hypothetical protein [Candidatus Woesearchaeota archaeon]